MHSIKPKIPELKHVLCAAQAQQSDGALASALVQQAGHLAEADRLRHEMADSHVQKFREETHHRQV